MITPDELEILRKPEVQEYIREKMGLFNDGDMYECEFCHKLLVHNEEYTHDCLNGKEPNNDLIIPDCISRDSSRPERGLWGMLLAFHYPDLHYNAYANEWVVDLIEKDTLTRVGFHHADTPRLALLKALEWQIGRKP
jgi:hypothetical protein